MAFPQRRHLVGTLTLVSLTTLAACSGSGVSGEAPPPITTSSSAAEMALAEHLTSIGAKKYGAWWCPHCHSQQALFGKDAFAKITYIECDPEGQNAQPTACQTAGVASYPSWDINGTLYPGVQPLENLAEISGYDGPTSFQN